MLRIVRESSTSRTFIGTSGQSRYLVPGRRRGSHLLDAHFDCEFSRNGPARNDQAGDICESGHCVAASDDDIRNRDIGHPAERFLAPPAIMFASSPTASGKSADEESSVAPAKAETILTAASIWKLTTIEPVRSPESPMMPDTS